MDRVCRERHFKAFVREVDRRWHLEGPLYGFEEDKR
jgi:hypothetical protein